MNVLTGLEVSAMTLNTLDNFNSIEGLKLWLDGRERVTKNGGGEVSLWDDKSSEANNFYQNKVNQKPNNISNLWIDSSPTIVPSVNLRSNRIDYRFMHNGSPFGIYSLVKLDLSTLANAISIINSSSATMQHGFSFQMNSTGSGRIVITVRGGGVIIRQTLLQNILVAHPGLGIYIVKHIWKGTGVAGNSITQFGNVLSTISSAAVGYTNNDSDILLICGNSTIGQTFKTGLTLLYDWTGKTPEQIDSYDTRIMAQLNAEKLLFQQLDV